MFLIVQVTIGYATDRNVKTTSPAKVINVIILISLATNSEIVCDVWHVGNNKLFQAGVMFCKHSGNLSLATNNEIVCDVWHVGNDKLFQGYVKHSGNLNLSSSKGIGESLQGVL